MYTTQTEYTLNELLLGRNIQITSLLISTNSTAQTIIFSILAPVIPRQYTRKASLE
jgi:hypothetical protein